MFSPGRPCSLALIPILLSVAWGSFNAAKMSSDANKVKNAFALALLMVSGLFVALLYAGLSIPLWFAQGSSIDADSEEYQHI